MFSLSPEIDVCTLVLIYYYFSTFLSKYGHFYLQQTTMVIATVLKLSLYKLMGGITIATSTFYAQSFVVNLLI